MFEELGVFSIVQCIADGPIMNAVNGKSYSHLYMCPVYVSHSWLFPKCVTVIHHGGAGTVSSAIVAGVPQVCYFSMLFLYATELLGIQHFTIITSSFITIQISLLY